MSAHIATVGIEGPEVNEQIMTVHELMRLKQPELSAETLFEKPSRITCRAIGKGDDEFFAPVATDEVSCSNRIVERLREDPQGAVSGLEGAVPSTAPGVEGPADLAEPHSIPLGLSRCAHLASRSAKSAGPSTSGAIDSSAPSNSEAAPCAQDERHLK